MSPPSTPAQGFATLIQLIIRAIRTQGFRGLLAIPAIFWLRAALRDFETLIADIKAGIPAEPQAPQPEARRKAPVIPIPPRAKRTTRHRASRGNTPPGTETPEIRQKPPRRRWHGAGWRGGPSAPVVPTRVPRKPRFPRKSDFEAQLRHGFFITISQQTRDRAAHFSASAQPVSPIGRNAWFAGIFATSSSSSHGADDAAGAFTRIR
jgi:hypothetical protein